MKKKPSHLSEAILEMAGDQHRVGIMSDTDYRQITIRHLGPKAPATARAISARQIQPEPGGLRPLPQPDARLRLAIRTRSQAAQGPGAGPAQRHPPQGS
jgi:hypothetical protein